MTDGYFMHCNPFLSKLLKFEKYTVIFTLCILNVGVITCHSGKFKTREIFYFLFTLKRLMANIFPDEIKCPSYKDACLTKVIFNKKSSTEPLKSMCYRELSVMCKSEKILMHNFGISRGNIIKKESLKSILLHDH